MKLSNTFEVDLPPGEAWAVLMDIERIVPCVPGAALIDAVGDDAYKGKVSVKLGPVALSFAGTVTFEDIDNAGKQARLRAQGSDEKGRGGAIAKVDFRLEPQGAGSRVVIDTDLVLSGSVAQYGRAQGVIAEVARELTDQFAACLALRLADETVSPGAVSGDGEDATSRDQPAAPARPLSAAGLMIRLLQNALARAWKRLTGGS